MASRTKPGLKDNITEISTPNYWSLDNSVGLYRRLLVQTHALEDLADATKVAAVFSQTLSKR